MEYLTFGRELERRRFRYLPAAAKARKALVVADGDGRFLARLARANPASEIDYVDLSARMLALARTRAGARVRYRQADARTCPLPPAAYDLLATHFFFDFFGEAELDRLIPHLAQSAAPGAIWLISEFRQPARGFPALWARLWLGTLYWFFGWTTGLENQKLADHHPHLRACGFDLQSQEVTRWGLLASELWVRA